MTQQKGKLGCGEIAGNRCYAGASPVMMGALHESTKGAGSCRDRAFLFSGSATAGRGG